MTGEPFVESVKPIHFRSGQAQTYVFFIKINDSKKKKNKVNP